MNKFLVLIIAFALSAVAISEAQGEEKSKKKDDWTYTIFKDTNMPPYKRSVEVRISARVSKEVLKEIAIKIKSMDKSKYERTFIGYYLPDMKVGHGYWATTHYNPDLEVQILGATEDQREKMIEALKKDKPEREIIGRWFYEQPYISNTIVLFRKKNKIFMEETYKDGSSRISEMIEKKVPQGMKYQEVDSDAESDFFILNSKGDLEIRDSYGLIVLAKKIQ